MSHDDNDDDNDDEDDDDDDVALHQHWVMSQTQALSHISAMPAMWMNV